MQATAFSNTDIGSSLIVLLNRAAEAVDNCPATARSLLLRATALLEAEAAGKTSGTGARGETGQLASWQLQRITRHIGENMDGPIPIEDLAAAISLSVSYFSRAFRATTGSTPHAFVMVQRMEAAKRLMLLSDERLSAIALACGFSDQAHFCRVFRAQEGMTPMQWRRNRIAGPAA